MTVENLEINVKTNANTAAKKVESLGTALNNLQAAAGAFNGSGITSLAIAMSRISNSKITASSFTSVSKGIEKIAIAMQAITPEAIANFDKLAAAMSKLQGVNLSGISGAVRTVGKSTAGLAPITDDMQGIISSASAIDVLQAKLLSLKFALQDAFEKGDVDRAYQLRGQILQTEAALEKATAAANKNAAATARVGQAASKAAKGGLATFAASLKRIAFYRLLRTIIKEITQAFTEGIKNAYNFSKYFSTKAERPLATSLDNLATKALTMKNQMGAAFGAALQVIEPIVLAIINLVTQLMNALSALYAAIGGGQYLVAKDAETSWNKATGAAQKYKNTVLGFDELNKLDAPGGGGGANGSNFWDMFTEGDLPEWAQKIRDFMESTIEPFIAELKINFNDILFEWDDLNSEQIAKKVITGLSALLGAAVGFMIGGVPGAVVGTLIGGSLGIVFSTMTFDNDGELSKDEIGKMVCAVAGALAGGAIGFFFGNLPGALIGASVGAALSMTIANLEFIAGESQGQKILGSLVPALGALAGGLLGFAIGGLPGAVIGATVVGGISLIAEAAIFKTSGDKSSMLMRTLIVVLGALAGGLIGFAIGGPLGLLIGVTVGVGITLSVGSALFGESGKDLERAILESLRVVLAAIGGAAIGFVIGGPLGAALGAIIAVGVTLVANSVEWDKSSQAQIQQVGTTVTLDGFSHGGTGGKKFNNFTLGAGEFGYASGGFPSMGSVFVAGELGPEFVGNIGGRTGVVNTDQMAGAVAEGNVGVIGAVYAMANAIVDAINNKDTTLDIDGQTFARVLHEPMREEQNRRGTRLVSGGAY